MFEKLVVHRTGRARDVTMQGRAYKVFPARLVQEQVLENNVGATFVPANEIAKSVNAWNGIPVVERHPERKGVAISARSPEVLDQVGVGYLFNARMDGTALMADVYLDADRVAALPDTASYVANAEQGDTGEVSTGFAALLTNAPGEHAGRKYDYLMTNLAPDHLAILPDQIGACSVKDGCGLGVTNCAGGCKCGGSKSSEAPAPVLTVDAFNAMSDDERRGMLSSSIRAAYGATGADAWVADVFSDSSEVIYSVEGPGKQALMRAKYTIGADGAVTLSDAVPVRRVMQYEPIANASGTTTTTPRDSYMNREEMIARLVANGTSKATADGLSDAQLATLVNAGGTPSDPDAAAAWAVAHDYRQKFEDLQNRTAPLLAREATERTELIDDLLFNQERHQFTQEEVRAMELPALRKLHNAICKRPSYTGRGGPVANAQGDGDFSFASRGILTGGERSVLNTKREG